MLYHVTTRDTITGGVFGPDERVSREEALRALTLGNAWLTFEDDLKGSLTTGKLADLVVLSHDILTCSDKDLRHARVSMTRGTEAAEDRLRRVLVEDGWLE